jgi:hypothetical protein
VGGIFGDELVRRAYALAIQPDGKIVVVGVLWLIPQFRPTIPM